MTLRTKIINEIISSVDKIPEKQLKEILEFVKNVEKKTNPKESILSYAGKWSELDDDVLKLLTNELHSNRKKDQRNLKPI